MGKRLLFLLVAIVGITLQSMAQTNRIPKVQKFVKVTATGVNFRQKPNVKSKKLGWYSEGDGSILAWLASNAKLSEYERINETILPVTGENGDWYQVYLSILWGEEGDYGYYGRTAYIMKKFCQEIAQRPLSLPSPNLNVKMVQTGEYKGYCFYLEENSMNKDCLFIGKKVGNIFVFDHFIHVWGNMGNYYQESGAHFQKDVNYDFKRFIFDENVATDWTLDLGKLIAIPKVYTYLLRNLSQTTPTYRAFFGVEEDQDWHVIAIED
jgi:hypothetical protein